MSIHYYIENKLGEVLINYENSACFSQLPYLKEPRVLALTNRIVYNVETNVEHKYAEQYLRELKRIGFCITQRPKDILKDGYILPFTHILRGPNQNQLDISEIGGNLTAVRYLEEERQIIYNFLNIIHTHRKFDRWKAFQLAHFIPVDGPHRGGEMNNSNHALLSVWGGLPFKPWKNIIAEFESVTPERVWNGVNRFKINLSYGLEHPKHNGNPGPAKPARIHNKQTLKEAVAYYENMQAVRGKPKKLPPAV